MIVGIAVETTVDSNDASALTSTSASVTARRRAGSKRGDTATTGPQKGGRGKPPENEGWEPGETRGRGGGRAV